MTGAFIEGPRSFMASVFGPEWEWLLTSEGIVGGSDDDDVNTDKIRVVTLAKAKRPDLGEDALAAVGDAWFEIWCDSGTGDG